MGQDLLTPDLLTPDLLSPDLLSPDLLSPDLLSPDLLSPDTAPGDPCMPNPCKEPHKTKCSVDIADKPVCACEPSYFGVSCKACPGGAASPCNDHGKCNDGLTGDGLCTCDPWYSGTACETNGPCIGTIEFPNPTVMTVSSTPYRTVAADFNNDGKLDLAVSNNETNQKVFTILLNKGKAQFEQAATYAAASDRSVGIAAGDLNGDKIADVAIATYGSDYSGKLISLSMNEGDGTFGSPIAINTADTNPMDIGIADFDKDGKNDLAITHNNGAHSLRVFLQGANSSSYALQYNSGYLGNPHQLGIGDLNADGTQDIVVGSYYSGLNVFINNGSGKYTKYSYASGNRGLIALGDFTNDGDLDIVTRNGQGLLTLENGGSGTYMSAYPYTLQSLPIQIKVGDINRDGNQDIVMSIQTGKISIMFGEGNGKFGSENLYDIGLKAQGLDIGDFSGDGRPDIAVIHNVDNKVSVLTTSCKK